MGSHDNQMQKAPVNKLLRNKIPSSEAALTFCYFSEYYSHIFIRYMLYRVFIIKTLSPGILFSLLQTLAVASVFCPEFLVSFR